MNCTESCKITSVNLSGNHNYNLDLMKILACIAVIGLHTQYKNNLAFYFGCGFAIPVFLMCSGYILLNRNKVTVSYVIKKLCSILRVVLMWSLVMYVSAILPIITNGEKAFNIYSLVEIPLIMLDSLLQRGNLWQFWYLGTLMIIYMLLPLMLRMRSKAKYVWTVCLAVGFVLQGMSYIGGTPIQKYIIQTFRIWTWIQYFILGGQLAENKIIREKTTAFWHGIILIVLTVVNIICQIFMGSSVIHNLAAEYFYDDPLELVWIIALFTFVMRLNLTSRAVSIIKKLSSITVGIYIIHPFVIKAMENIVFGVNTALASFLCLVGVLTVSAIACCIMNLVPIIKRLIEI